MAFVKIESKKYPSKLLQVKNPPKKLFYKGNFSPSIFDKCIAVVGSRRVTAYGESMTNKLVDGLRGSGITVVSGFMYGVDALAHMAALGANLKTIAVLPGGVDLVHPEYQRVLYDKIVASGLVLSEFEGEAPALKWSYPRRNRIVAGLSSLVVVIEAGASSGSMITANIALASGIPVYVVPRNFGSKNSEGIFELVKKGAQIVTDSVDILKFFGLNAIEFKKQSLNLDASEKKVLSLLDSNGLSFDDIVRKSELPASNVSQTVTRLELKGLLKLTGGFFYAS